MSKRSRMGRPRVPAELKKSVRLTVPVTDTIAEAIKSTCAPGEVADWMRGAIAEKLAQAERSSAETE